MTDTRTQILDTGVTLWRAGVEPSARRIATELALSGHAAVFYHFPTTKRLTDAIATYAVMNGESRIIVKLIASGHAAVEHMPDAERVQHLRACV